MTEPTQTAVVPCPFCGQLNRVDLGKLDAGPRCGGCARPILLDRPVQLSDENFARVIAGTTVPVIVDFYAVWCGPCKIMAPIFDELAAEWKGRALVAKLDTDQAPGTSQHYGVRGIPTMIVFRNGQEAGRQVGAVPKTVMEQLLTR